MVKAISLSDFNMSLLKILSSSSFILNTFYFGLMFTSIHATNFVIKNSCGYTVWAAAVPANVSVKLEPSESLNFNHDSSSKVVGSVWARTDCYFDTEGNGKCESGDCNGHLDCTGLPDAPVTLAEYTLRGSDKEDFFHISLLKGFNVPMDFRSTSASCNKAIMCAADINGLCPIELRDPGGCNHPCTVFNNDQFCCSNSSKCGPSAYFKFFNDLCPSALTHKVDNTTSFFACPTGTDYQVELCPQNPSRVNTTAFNVINNCPYTVWAAAVPGGGRRLDQGETWILNMASGTSGHIWARTNCQFDASGKGSCETGDCGGLVQCQSYGSPPKTLAEFALNQFNNLDFIDMSNIDGFNVPMAFSSVSDECHLQINCTADIIGECPNELKVPGGCNGPCPAFKTDEYCCNSGNCEPTNYSRFFKDRCPDVYSYPKDDATSTFTCPGGTDYKIVFCP